MQFAIQFQVQIIGIKRVFLQNDSFFDEVIDTTFPFFYAGQGRLSTHGSLALSFLSERRFCWCFGCRFRSLLLAVREAGQEQYK